MTSTSVPDAITLRTREPARWSAIFAGTFAFLAVEATFGVLGTAIFASSANPNAAHPISGMSAGMGIWTVVLTIIALYVAGRTAGHLSGATRKLDGMYHGLVTFGLCIFASVLVAAMIVGSTMPAAASTTATAGTATIGSMVATGGWWLFFSLLLGGWAAISGGSNAIEDVRTPAAVRDIRDTNVRKAA
jgi:hypothetical protein